MHSFTTNELCSHKFAEVR